MNLDELRRRPLSELSREELARLVEGLEASTEALRERCARTDAQVRELEEACARAEPARPTATLWARFFDVAPVAAVFLDDKGLVVEANLAAQQLFDRERATLVGKPFVVVAEMSDSAPFWRHMQRCTAAAEVVRTGVKIAPRGAPVAVEMISALDAGAATGKRKYPTLLFDVSAHEELARELRSAHESELHLRAQMERVSAAHLVITESVAELPRIGLDGVLQTIAEQARHLADAEASAVGLGGSAQRPFDKWVQSGVDPETARQMAIPRPVGVLALLADGAAVRLREPAGHPAFRGIPRSHPELASFLAVPITHAGRVVGGLYLANKRAAPEFDADDEIFMRMLAPRAAMAIEIAVAAERVEKQRAWLQAAIDQTPEPMVISDAEGHLLVNRRAHELDVAKEGERDPLGNAVVFDLRRPSGEPIPWEERPLIRSLRYREVTERVDVQVVTRDGEIVPMALSSSPILDHDTITGAVTVWRDLTALRVIERLREEWAAMVAHDLRQPLAAIRMSDDLLARAPAGGAQASRAVDRIRIAVDRMVAMLDELVDTSLLEAGQLRLKRERLDAAAVIQEIVEQLADLLSGTGQPVTVRVAEGVPPIYADRARVERVLANLLSNAAKYGEPDGEIVVAVDAVDGMVRVSVRNRGFIEAAALTSLFTRFYRTPEAHEGRKAGLGLGLFIAKGLVEAHGGRIQATSEGGEVEISFTLPVASA